MELLLSLWYIDRTDFQIPHLTVKQTLPSSESGIEVAIFVPGKSSKICSPLHFSVFQFAEPKNKTKDC
jgi:hypothetical protein